MSGVRPEKGSLATKVVSADDSIGDIALAYAGYILGRTACVTDMDAHVAESPKVAAVTADGAYYRGFARAQLDERVIGQRMVGAEARAAASGEGARGYGSGAPREAGSGRGDPFP